MSNQCLQTDSPVKELKNETARKRWELFHLAITHAKKSNAMAMQETDTSSAPRIAQIRRLLRWIHRLMKSITYKRKSAF